MNKNYYKILEVEENATQKDIKASYRKLAKKYHPDTNKENKSYEEKFKQVAEAYDTLGDSEKRKNYDESRRNPYQRNNFGGFKQSGFGFEGGFGFDEFVKSAFNRNSARNNNTSRLNIKVKTQADLQDLINESEIKVLFERKLFDKSKENKEIKFKIDLRKRKYDIRKISNDYVIVIKLSGLGDELKGIRNNAWGGSEEFHAIGDLIVEIKIISKVDFKIEDGNIHENININLYDVLFNKDRDYIVNSALGKKYRLDICNPKNLSSLKFTVKSNGVVGNNNKLGDYVANLIVNSPDLSKMNNQDLKNLKDILSKV